MRTDLFHASIEESGCGVRVQFVGERVVALTMSSSVS